MWQVSSFSFWYERLERAAKSPRAWELAEGRKANTTQSLLHLEPRQTRPAIPSEPEGTGGKGQNLVLHKFASVPGNESDAKDGSFRDEKERKETNDCTLSLKSTSGRGVNLFTYTPGSRPFGAKWPSRVSFPYLNLRHYLNVLGLSVQLAHRLCPLMMPVSQPSPTHSVREGLGILYGSFQTLGTGVMPKQIKDIRRETGRKREETSDDEFIPVAGDCILVQF